jgi:hypothetical protein
VDRDLAVAVRVADVAGWMLIAVVLYGIAVVVTAGLR